MPCSIRLVFCIISFARVNCHMAIFLFITVKFSYYLYFDFFVKVKVNECFGDWRSEKTKIGRMVSAALMSILIGLAASNLRIIAYEAPAYNIVMGFLLPLTIPLLLFRADMHRVIQSTGRLLLAFLLGSGCSFMLTTFSVEKWMCCITFIRRVIAWL